MSYAGRGSLHISEQLLFSINLFRRILYKFWWKTQLSGKKSTSKRTIPLSKYFLNEIWYIGELTG